MATPGVTSSSAGGDWNWRGALVGLLFVPATWGMTWGLSLVGDQTRAATHVAQSQSEKTVMVCMGGVIDYAEPGLYARLFTKGYFRCTDWRMRE